MQAWMRATALATAVLASGCAWVGLARGALSYPTTQDGEAANVVASGNWAYVTRGAAGIEVIDLRPGGERRTHRLPEGLGSVDDLAIADGLLFVLDARIPGHLGVLSLADPSWPSALGAPVDVEVGPFSGVAAGGGRVVVSGGTSRLSLRRYDTRGLVEGVPAVADFGRGQPDVLLGPQGDFAAVSTHEWGPHFSLRLARLAGEVTGAGELALDTYGFTPGGAKPANFPVETAIEGRRLYVASAGGLSVVDAADLAAPRVVARIDPGVQGVNIDVRAGLAAVVGSEPVPTLVFVDVRDPAHPKVLQSFRLPEGSRATGVALTASAAVVAAHGRGALVFPLPFPL